MQRKDHAPFEPISCFELIFINHVIPPADSALGWIDLWVVSVCVGGGPGRVNGQKRKR